MINLVLVGALIDMNEPVEAVDGLPDHWFVHFSLQPCSQRNLKTTGLLALRGNPVVRRSPKPLV